MDLPPVSTVIFLVIVAIVVALFWRKVSRDVARMEARIEGATPAQAKVVAVGRSHTQKNQGTVVVHLRLEVYPPQGEAYQVRAVWEIDPASIPKVQEEQRVAVKIDQEDTNIIFPRVPWAQYSWMHSRAESREEQEPVS
jgi:hypothetical protein